MISKINESLEALVKNTNVICENCKKQDIKEDFVGAKQILHNALINTVDKLMEDRIINLKQYEIDLQNTIEELYPDKAWWEVTDANIFMELLNTKNPYEVVEIIVDNMKPEVVSEGLNRTQKVGLKEGRWNYTLKSGKALRDVIEDEDLLGICSALQLCYQELFDAGIIDEDDKNEYISAIDFIDLEDEDVEDQIDWELDNLYDLCDNLGVWVDFSDHIEEGCNNKAKKHIKKKSFKSIKESLTPREKQIYINEINKVEDREDLEDIVHEIFWYDKRLFAKINKFPKNASLKEIKNHIIKELNNGSVKESKQSIKRNLIKEGWFDDYRDYDPKDGWTKEDIAKHKEIDWESRNYNDLDVGDEFKGNVYIYRADREPEIKKDVTFHKFLRSNPIFPPYYRPVDLDVKGVVGSMYDGRKHKTYNVHDRYEDQATYDMLSDSLH